MNIQLAKKDNFLNSFLTPISKVTNSATISVEKDQFSSLISTNDNTIILNAIYKNKNDTEATLNIPYLNKLARILSIIDSEYITLEINKNNISYSSNNIRFKYHLFEDGIIISPKLNVSKLSTLQFDGTFTLQFPDLQNLIKGSSIATDSNKIYLTLKDSCVLGELTDKARPNVDSYGLIISNKYKGINPASPIPLNFEIFRIISSMKYNSLLGQIVTSMGVMTFDMISDTTKIKFVVSALLN